MRPRFRLRTLLVLMALAAAACWWIVRPTAVANQFIAAVARSDGVTLESLWSGPPTDTNRANYLRVLSSLGSDTNWRWDCRLLPRTLPDVLRGIRRIDVTLRNSDRPGASPYFEKYPTLFAGPRRVDVASDASMPPTSH